MGGRGRGERDRERGGRESERETEREKDVFVLLKFKIYLEKIHQQDALILIGHFQLSTFYCVDC